MRLQMHLAVLFLGAAWCHSLHAQPVPTKTFVNDSGYRWEYGEELDVTLSGEDQGLSSGVALPMKTATFNPESVFTPHIERDLDSFRVSVSRAAVDWGAGILHDLELDSRSEPFHVIEEPRLRYGGTLWVTTDRWKEPFDVTDGLDSFYLAVSGGRRADAKMRRGFVELTRVGEIEVDGHLYPDYQPLSWGYYNYIPEPTSAALLALATIPWGIGRRR